MTRALSAALACIALGAALQLARADDLLDFQPGGYIHIDNSFGYLTVEGWDEPKVEVTVVNPAGQIRVVTERRSDRELAIFTTRPARRAFPFSILASPPFRHNATLECRVYLPRDSRVAVHHGYGYVWVSDVSGDVEVDSHTGDMIVMLPDPGRYSIDAKTGLGRISSDLTGHGNERILVGSHFVHAEQAPARRIFLRMGRGSITIKNGPPSGPFWKD